MKQLIEENNLILMEAAIAEPLMRVRNVELHPSLLNAPAIYDPDSKTALKALYQSYIDIAQKSSLPILLLTPTWRANFERVSAEPIMLQINLDAVQLLKGIRAEQGNQSVPIKIGGLVGCKNDAYDPSQCLSCDEAESFHQWQIDQLAEAKPDYLIAETLPSIEEATGIARAMAKTNLPYIISFVVNRQGYLLDGTNLINAIEKIDSIKQKQPTGYMVNCSYPTFICAEKQPKSLFKRLIGCQANASSLDHSELDESTELKTENIAEWGNEMVKLNQIHGIKILGGCCGTRKEHLEYIVREIFD